MPADQVRPLVTTALLDSGIASTILKIWIKRAKGEPISARENQELTRFEREAQRLLRREIYRAVPFGEYCGLAGRQAKVVNEQRDKYGVPVGGVTVELAPVIQWLHDFVRDNARTERQTTPAGTARERKLQAEAKMAEIALERTQGEWLRRSEVHDCFSEFGNHISKASAELQRRFGPEAQVILDEFIERATMAAKRLGDNGVCTSKTAP